MTPTPNSLMYQADGRYQAPRVLLVEPNPDEAADIIQAVHAYYDQDVITHFDTLEEALVSEELDQANLAICEMDTGDYQGAAILEELLLLRPDLPVIMLDSDHAQFDAAVLMREGAYDYLVKSQGYLQLMPVMIEKNLTLFQVKQENARLQIQLTATLGQLRTKNEQLEALVTDLKSVAATDSLTGIANRRAITQALDQRFAHAVRHDSELTVIAIDLDGFKKLNDSAGHAAGDRVLIQVARVLTANARGSDVPGRIGGDEFVVVLPETEPDEAVKVAQRIQMDFELVYNNLMDRIKYDGTVTLSIGVATRRKDQSASATELLADADRALYRAKDAGRACIMLSDASA